MHNFIREISYQWWSFVKETELEILINFVSTYYIQTMLVQVNLWLEPVLMFYIDNHNKYTFYGKVTRESDDKSFIGVILLSHLCVVSNCLISSTRSNYSINSLLPTNYIYLMFRKIHWRRTLSATFTSKRV